MHEQFILLQASHDTQLIRWDTFVAAELILVVRNVNI